MGDLEWRIRYDQGLTQRLKHPAAPLRSLAQLSSKVLASSAPKSWGYILQTDRECRFLTVVLSTSNP